MTQTNSASLVHFDILESTQFKTRPTFVLVLDARRVQFLVAVVTVGFLLERLSTSKLSLCQDVENDLAVLWQSLTGVFRKGFGGAPLLEVHYSLAHIEYVRSPIFIPSSLFIPEAHAYANTHAHTLACTHRQTRTDMLLNGRALLLPQSMEYHICLFTPRFLSLNSINIYIAAEGVGSPSCSGRNSAQMRMSFSRAFLGTDLCVYTYIIQLFPNCLFPVLVVFLFFLFFFFSSYHHLLQLASYVTL